MSIVLRIKTDNKELKELYKNHKPAYEGDIGLDLFCPYEVEVPAHNYPPIILDFEIACEVIVEGELLTWVEDKTTRRSFIKDWLSGPQGHYEKLPKKERDRNLSFMLVPRSSIVKTPLMMANSLGIIDTGFRNNLRAAIYNMSDKSFVIKKNSRLFQIVLFGGNNGYMWSIDGVEFVDALSPSERGEKGFGSSGQ